MTAAVQAIAIAAPTAIAQGIFAIRRTNSCVDSFSENPIYGGCNGLIATSQVAKATRAASDIKPVGEAIHGAAETIKNTSLAADITKDVSSVTKTLNGIGSGLKTVINFIADTINPFICITSLAKVIFGDEENKVKAGIREGISIATMFGFENAYKAITGMPKISYENGKQISTAVEGLYKKIPALKKHTEKFVQKCNTTKLFNKIPMNSMPSILKGLGFAVASITGYKVGSAIAKQFDND